MENDNIIYGSTYITTEGIWVKVTNKVIWTRKDEEEENCMSPIELYKYQKAIDNHDFI